MSLGLRQCAAEGASLCATRRPRTLLTGAATWCREQMTSGRGGDTWWCAAVWLLVILVSAARAASNDKPPRFIVEPESKVVKVHSEVRLHCRVEPPSSTVRWLREGQYLRVGSLKDIYLERGTLVFRPFRHRPRDLSHTGVYQCEASTGAGTIVSRNATLARASLGQFEDGSVDLYVNATEGNIALIPCVPPPGSPPPVTSFELNGTLLDPSVDRHLLLPSGNLQIAKVRQSDQGTYLCVATNPVTGLQRRAPNHVHLKVIVPTVNTVARIVRSPQTPVEVMRDGNLTLECVAEGSPVPVVTWEKYGGQLPEGRYTQRWGNLIIHQVELLDQGTYICRAGNSGRGAVFRHTVVDVLEPPMIRVPPRDKVVKMGSTVTLHCEPQTNDRVKTDAWWLHNGKVVTPGRTVIITETALTLHNVQKEQAGMYQCIVHNKLGSIYAAAWLQVRDKGENITAQDLAQTSNQMQDIAPDSLLPPSEPTIVVPPTNMTVVAGASIVLPCTPKQVSPSLEIVWHKDAKPIVPRQTFATLTRKVPAEEDDAESSQEEAAPDSRYKVAPSGSLQIFNARPEDGGQYTCILANQGGIDTATGYLTVPDPATTSQYSGAVLKTPPPDPFLSAVTPSPPAGNVTKVLEDGDEDVEGRGRGRGRGGRKKKTKKKRKKKKKVDDPPVREGEDVILVPPSRPVVSKLSDTSVLLKWEVPSNDGLSITFFKVQYKNLHQRDSRYKGWHTVDEDIASNTRNYEVVGLHPGSTYKFRVVAVYSNNDNKQGQNSARFTLSVQPAQDPEPPVECPVIVGARPLSATEIRIEWQYLDVHQAPIEGFKVFYKPYHAKTDFLIHTVPFRNQRIHKITGLHPNTEYSLNMQSFNRAGSSVMSNSVVTRTLGLSDVIAPVPSLDPALLSPRITSTLIPMYAPNPINTQSSSELLYTVLGVVLGTMMLLLLVFMALCGWKQRQQRQMMAALNANIRKFDDPSKSIYIDSMRKKYGYTGGFMLNGITPTMTNGHAPPVTNGHIPIPNYTSERQNASGTLNGSKINISVNPLTAELDSRNMDDSGHPSLDDNDVPDLHAGFSDYDPNNDGSESDSRNGQSLAELRTSLKEALSQTGPGLQPNYGEILYGSMDNHSPQRSDSEAITLPQFYSPTTQAEETEHLYDPPDYSSLQRLSPDPTTQPLVTRRPHQDHMVVVPRRQSHEHIPLTDMSSQQAVIIDRLSTFSRGSPVRMSAGDAGDMPAGSVKPHRRRRRRHRGEHVVKDMATNTGMGSKEGRLDGHPRYNTLPHQPRDIPRWETPPRVARTPSPASTPQHFTSELLDKVPHDGHAHSHSLDPVTNNSALLAYTDLPRVHDYPPSPDEDGDDVN